MFQGSVRIPNPRGRERQQDSPVDCRAASGLSRARGEARTAACEARCGESLPLRHYPQEGNFQEKIVVNTYTLRKSLVAGCCLLLMALVIAVAGCSSDGENPVTTSVTGPNLPTSAPPAPTTEGTTMTIPDLELSEWDKQLADNANVQRKLAMYLGDIDADDDDPLVGLYYGLQARTRALSCRKALAESNLELADTAMREVYYALNLGKNVATGPTAETLAGAYAIVESLGSPSNAPTEAAVLLEQFIETLALFKDEASGILVSTTTTT